MNNGYTTQSQHVHVLMHQSDTRAEQFRTMIVTPDDRSHAEQTRELRKVRPTAQRRARPMAPMVGRQMEQQTGLQTAQLTLWGPNHGAESSDGAESDGEETDGAENDGAESDGAESGGAESEV